MVQLAALKTRSGAKREWLELQRRFPELLANMHMTLDEAKLASGTSVIRLRTGGFATKGAAAALCERLTAARQDCFVIRASASK